MSDTINNTTKQFLDKDGLDTLWNKICQTFVPKNGSTNSVDTPIVYGDADNSAVLEGEYTVGTTTYSNKALSQISVSLGAGSTAGLKGWYYSAITFGDNPVITLSDTQPYVFLNALIGGNWSSGTPNISVGDKISIVNDVKYDYCGVVKSVSGNKVTLEGALPFDSLSTSLISANNPDDWTIYLPEHADAGMIDFGGGALAEGVNTQATNIGAHAEGIQTHAYGQYSHTEGFRTKAGYAAHAEGKETIASGSRSHAEGQDTVASAIQSHAEGHKTQASGIASHSEGNETIASGDYSHAEGQRTRAQGVDSHAEGRKTHAVGHRSHAGGESSIANGDYSFVHGNNVKANNECEVAFGKYNDSMTNTLFSVGNGTSNNNRKNAVEIYTDGQSRFAGMTHFDNDIHLCRKGDAAGGTIYFGDSIDVDESERDSYVYICETEDDILDIHAQGAIKLNSDNVQIYDEYIATKEYIQRSTATISEIDALFGDFVYGDIVDNDPWVDPSQPFDSN